MTPEHYKQIPNYSQYLVSEQGDIWDIKQDKHLSWISNGGYACVNLYRDDGKKILEKVHRCIAYAFLPKPEGSPNTLLHIDLNRMNNTLSNLRWKVKGKSDPSHLRFHTLNGKKYHKTTLESLAERCSLTWECARQRLDAGWTEDELLQGYRQSEVFYLDDMQFIGYHTVKRYRDMLDKDVKAKEKYQQIVENQHQQFLWELQNQSWKDRRNGLSEGEYDVAVKVWNGIMRRCYNQSSQDYHRYGAAGVTVCDEWKNVGNFVRWWRDNYIPGFEVEKDILPFVNKTPGMQYSSDNCCFVHKDINAWFASLSSGVKIKARQNGTFYTVCSVTRDGVKIRVPLSGISKGDIQDQYNLLKTQRAELHLHKLKELHNKAKTVNPKTPGINVTLLKFMEEYEHSKYLLMKGQYDKYHNAG